jgi:hypothetical protein
MYRKKGIEMTRGLTALLILFIFISGCQPTTSEISKPQKDAQTVKPDPLESEEGRRLSIQNQNFERVVGWLTNEEILYVTRQGSDFSLLTYHIETGVSKEITKITDPIIEVRIHPDLSRFAVVTSKNSLSATIHILSGVGEEIDELMIESSEMYWDWDSNHYEQLFFSAFYEDWKFDSFVYSSEKKEISRIETKDPFGKWGHDSTIQTINWPPNDALSGGALRDMNIHSKTFKDSKDSNIIYMESFKEISLVVRISENQENFLYTITNNKDGKNATYEMPAVSNYSQWFVPEVEWLADGRVLTYQAAESGLMDSIPTDYELVQLTSESTVKQSIWEGPYGSFACSPSGTHCLIGVQLEEMLIVESGKVKPWIEIKE